MNTRALSIILGLILVGLVTGGSVYLYQQSRINALQHKPQPVVTAPTPTPAPTPAPVPTTTPPTASTSTILKPPVPISLVPSDWYTYSNGVLNVTFRYPPQATWTVNFAGDQVTFDFSQIVPLDSKMIVKNVKQGDPLLHGCYYGSTQAPSVKQSKVTLGKNHYFFQLTEDH